MLLDHTLEIHPIQLVAAQDQQVIEVISEEVNQILAHGIGGALVPGSIRQGLLGGEDLDEAAGKQVKLVRLGNMPVQRGGIELGQNVNAFISGVDAIGDGHIHDAVLAR